MARPTVAHQGFFVPNAQDVANPSMAEPDRIDFNTLGNSRWGVIEGCLVTVSGSTATITSGTVLNGGTLASVVGGQSVSLGTGGTQDRYDIVGVDTNGTLKVVRGSPSTDPVFPDPPTNIVTLAAVFAKSGISDYSDNVIDKRNMLLDSLLTKIPPEQSLIVNRNGSGNLYSVDGTGSTGWNDDTWLARIDVATLGVRDNLQVAGRLTVNGDTTVNSLAATSKVTGSNLRNATTMPATANPGDVWQNATSGRIYVWQNGAWSEIATLASAVPVATVITSLAAPNVMVPLGWVPLDGRTVDEGTYPTLFTVPALAQYITGTAPNRSMILPDARRRVFLTDFTAGGQLGGSNSISLLTSNLPPHKHNVQTLAAGALNMSARTGRAGAHRHAVTGGEHTHTVSDPGHKHRAMEGPTGLPGDPICAFWGGQNKIDALFNDRSHTYSVEPLQYTMPGLTGITISSAGSWHTHEVDTQGDHDHVITMDPVAAHVHATSEDTVGQGAAINTTPAHIAVYAYVRT